MTYPLLPSPRFRRRPPTYALLAVMPGIRICWSHSLLSIRPRADNGEFVSRRPILLWCREHGTSPTVGGSTLCVPHRVFCSHVILTRFLNLKVQNPSQWTYTSFCVCERMLRTHDPFTIPGAAPMYRTSTGVRLRVYVYIHINICRGLAAPSQAGLGVGSPVLSSFPGSAGVAQQAPCVAYQGLRSEASGNANTRRVDAYIRQQDAIVCQCSSHSYHHTAY